MFNRVLSGWLLAFFLRETASLFHGATSLFLRLAGATRNTDDMRCGRAFWIDFYLSCYTFCGM